MSLEQVFYVSRCSTSLTTADARLIVGTSQMLNRRADINGLLVFTGRYFAQVVEGERTAIDALLQRIGRDPRHEAIRHLLRRNVTQRVFGDWTMELLLSETLADRIETACASPASEDADSLGLLDAIVDEASQMAGRSPLLSAR